LLALEKCSGPCNSSVRLPPFFPIALAACDKGLVFFFMRPLYTKRFLFTIRDTGILLPPPATDCAILSGSKRGERADGYPGPYSIPDTARFNPAAVSMGVAVVQAPLMDD
jgi:hypothetical protein